MRTVPSTWWLLLAVVALTVALGAATAGALSAEHCPETGCREDVVKTSLSGVWIGQAAVAVLATLAVTSEYGTGTIVTTLTAMPGRLRMLGAKAAAVLAAVLAAGALGVLGSLLAGRAVLPPAFAPYGLTDSAVLRAGGGTVLYLALVALLALGVATAVRDTAGALAASLGVLYAAPLLAGLLADPDWAERAERYGPTTAGMSVQATTDLDRLAIGPWPGLGVLAGWAAAALLAGGGVLRRRRAGP